MASLSKEGFCFHILRKYSMLVDFEGTPAKKSVPKPIEEKETFKQWKSRVLGEDVTDVVVYTPVVPAPNTKIHTLINQSSAEHIENIFHAFGKQKDRQKKEAIEEKTIEIKHKFISFPKETLEDLLAENQNNIEPAVRDFFDRFLNSASSEIDTEEMLKALILSYNNVVNQYRKHTQQAQVVGLPLL